MGSTGKYTGYQVKYATDSHAKRGSASVEGSKGLDRFLTVYNDSPRQIVVKDRMGVTTYLPPQARKPMTAGKVMFQLQWYMDAMSLRYTIDDLKQRYPKPSALMTTMLHAFEDALHGGHRSGGLVTTTPIWIDIPVLDLQEAGGRIYIEELDYTVALLEDDNDRLDHPVSPAQRARNTISQVAPAMGRNTMFFMVKAVDNAPCKTHNDRYMWIGGDVYHIPVEYDQTMEEGIHVVCQPPATMKNKLGRHAQPFSMRYTFQEADDLLGLSTTIESAKHRGNSKESLAEKAIVLNLESKIREFEMTRQLNEEKWANEKQRLINEREREESKHQKDAEKAEAEATRMAWESKRREQDYRKAEQDLRREEGKNLVEWMRIIGGIITASAAIVTTIQKLKPA